MLREWLRGLLKGPDGETSVSNLVMFIGLGVPFPMAIVLLVLSVTGKVEWPLEPMNWLRDYSVVVILPYIFKRLSYMFSKPQKIDVSVEETGD